MLRNLGKKQNVKKVLLWVKMGASWVKKRVDALRGM